MSFAPLSTSCAASCANTSVAELKTPAARIAANLDFIWPPFGLDGSGSGSMRHSTPKKQPPRDLRSCPVGRSLQFPFERAERLLIDIPFLKNREDGGGGKSGPGELAKNPRRLLLVPGLHQTLALEIGSRLFCVTHFVLPRIHRFLDNVAVDSFRLEIHNHAPAAQFFIVAAEGTIRSR